MSRPRVMIAAGAGLAALATLAATLAMPGQVTWSDAKATTRLAPHLVVDRSVLVDGGVTAAGMTTIAALVPGAEVSAHGVVKSREEAVIASRMTALITALPLEAGQRFVRGQMLASFDCSQMKAQLAAAQAGAAATRKTYDTNVELDQYKAIGTNEVAVAKANWGKAAAEAQAIRAGTGQCSIAAPFAGTVVERIAHPHDVAAPGAPLMKIQGSGDLEVELIVPSGWLTWLKPGTPFGFAIDETGNSVTGSIARLGAAVDPVSKTLRVVGRIAVHGMVLPGMSGTAHFQQGDNGRAA